MKKLLLLSILVSCVFAFGCVSSSQKQETVSKSERTEPKWITDKGRLELFPSSSYVSQTGYGSTAQASKEKAAASISEYIKASVASSASSHYFYKEFANTVTEKKELREDMHVSTVNDLYKLEYTSPYYYADVGQYVCVAFINREQAFNFVKPKLEIARTQFPPTYYAALEKESLLDRIIGIKNAQKVLPDFYEVYDFARAILPEKAKVYEEVDSFVSKSVIKMRELCRSVLIRIEGVGDTDLLEKSGVVAELSNQFKNIGFVIGNSMTSNCIALVEVKALISAGKEAFETYPEISIRIMEKGVEKISYAKQLPKVVAFDRNVVVKRTNLALTKEVREAFVDECF